MGNVTAGLTLVIVFIIAFVLILKNALDLIWHYNERLSKKQKLYKVLLIVLGLLLLYGIAYMFDSCTV